MQRGVYPGLLVSFYYCQQRDSLQKILETKLIIACSKEFIHPLAQILLGTYPSREQKALTNKEAKGWQSCPIFCFASGHSRVVSHTVGSKAAGLEKYTSLYVHVQYQQK